MLGRGRVGRTHLNVVSSFHPFADNMPGRGNNDAQDNQGAHPSRIVGFLKSHTGGLFVSGALLPRFAKQTNNPVDCTLLSRSSAVCKKDGL